MTNRITETVNVLTMIKGEHRFVFIFDTANKTDVLRTLGRYASDPDLPEFTWYDATILSQRVRSI